MENDKPSRWESNPDRVKVKTGSSEKVKKIWKNKITNNILIVFHFGRAKSDPYRVEFFKNAEEFQSWKDKIESLIMKEEKSSYAVAVHLGKTAYETDSKKDAIQEAKKVMRKYPVYEFSDD